ncbi:hypothetical protein NSND_60748 [Nitrospira sp. ND1]|nr:hypothetical protein NSND_60748 [Nitrospira sp. ND1]
MRCLRPSSAASRSISINGPGSSPCSGPSSLRRPPLPPTALSLWEEARQHDGHSDPHLLLAAGVLFLPHRLGSWDLGFLALGGGQHARHHWDGRAHPAGDSRSVRVGAGRDGYESGAGHRGERHGDAVHPANDSICAVGLMNQMVMGWAYAWTVVLALWIWVYIRSLR